MLGFSFRLRPTRDDGRRVVAEHLKSRLRARLRLSDEDSVVANEIACSDPGCPAGLETIMLVMRRGEKTRAVKVRKAMSDVDDADIALALEEAGFDVAFGTEER